MALIDNIYAYYKLDEASGGALDATGNGRTLSNFGNAIGTASGIISTARDFGGVSGSTLIRNQNTTDFFCGANPFSFSFWVRFRTFPAFNDVGLCNRYEPFGQREYIVFLRQSDKRIVFNIESGASSAAVQWNTVASLNTWYHVAGGWDGTTIKLSINAGTFVTAAYSTPMVNGGDNFKLGYEAASLDGQMDEFGFWIGRCLTATEVTQLYNNGAGLDFSQFGTVITPPTTWVSDGSDAGGPNSIQVLHDQSACIDGDTITIPSGTFTWNVGVVITKAITLQGNTTIVGDHTTYGTTGVRPTVNDLTTIRDNVQPTGSPPTSKPLINQVNNSATGTFRLTGVTLTSAVRITTGSFMIQVAGTSSKIRIDHVHSTACNRPWTIGAFNAGGGVIDHYLCDPIGGTQEFDFRNRVGANGDEEFALPGSSFYGTQKIWYIEDSYIDNNVSIVNTAGGSDREVGGSLIWRYNFLHNAEIVTHGTYSGRRRGGRVGEECFNVQKWDGVKTLDGATAGSYMVHDNTFVGPFKPNGWSLRNYRTFAGTDTNWGGAGGNNPWDHNATRSDGTWHSGESPFVFYGPDIVTASTIVIGPGPTGGNMTITVAGSPWVVNQWIGYTACRSPDTPSATSYIGQVRSNTNNQLTMYWYSEASAGFPVGSVFRIYKLVEALDQPGMGQSDLVSPLTPPTPPAVGIGVHQQSEPCYSWNNIHTSSGQTVNFLVPSDSDHTVIEGTHFFNDTPALGHVDLVYPHPLVTGGVVTTRIIALSGIPSLAFGNVTIGSASPTAILRVSNSGNDILTVTGVTYPSGFTGDTSGFVVPSGSFYDITVTFTPLLPQLYSGVITVNSNATSGTATIVASGTGVDPTPVVHGHRKQARDAFGF